MIIEKVCNQVQNTINENIEENNIKFLIVIFTNIF